MRALRIATASLILTLAVCLPSGCRVGEPGLEGQAPSADGTAIHYLVRGSGSPALVFVHGWSCDAGYWQAQMEAFAPANRVVAVDLAGHGDSGSRSGEYTMEAFGQDVAAVLARLEITDAVLIGHSMGGAVIVEAALAAPERVRGLIGIDNFQQVSFGLTPEQIAGFTAAMEGNFRGVVEPWVKAMFPAGADSALVAQVAADMASAPPAVAVSAMRNLLAWGTDRAPERLPLLKVPLMCINADKEPTDEAALRAVIPGYQVRYMPGRGHFPMQEDPQQFNRLLAETVAAITVGRR